MMFIPKNTLSIEKISCKKNRNTINPSEEKKCLQINTRFLLKAEKGTKKYCSFLSNTAGNKYIVKNVRIEPIPPI